MALDVFGEEFASMIYIIQRFLLQEFYPGPILGLGTIKDQHDPSLFKQLAVTAAYPS